MVESVQYYDLPCNVGFDACVLYFVLPLAITTTCICVEDRYAPWEGWRGFFSHVSIIILIFHLWEGVGEGRGLSNYSVSFSFEARIFLPLFALDVRCDVRIVL